MEYLPNGFTLQLTDGAFPLSTDSMVLSHFVHLPRNANVLDLGSGCGTLGLLLCSRNENCTVTGLEITETAHLGAVENIRRNGLDARMESICMDLRSVSERFSPGSFSCVISNPPYFSGGPASKALTTARREDNCSCADQCPVEAISEGEGKYVIDADVCVSCGACADQCPVEAIEEG